MSQDVLMRALTAHQQGRLADAERGYRVVLASAPDHADALYLLGVLLHQSGRSRDAIVPLRRVTAQVVRADALNTLGDAHRVLGEHAEARSVLERAYTLAPLDAAIATNLALTLAAMGARQDALVLLFNAVAAIPAHRGLRQLLAASLDGLTLGSANDAVRGVLLQLVADAEIATQSLAGAVLGLVKSTAAFQQVDHAVTGGADPFVDSPDALNALLSYPLSLQALPRLIVGDVDVERVLTAVRRWTLHRVVTGNADGDVGVSLEALTALAAQCFNTEYAWAVTGEERAQLARLLPSLTAGPDDWSPVHWTRVALAACYQSLARLSWSEPLATNVSQLASSPTPIRALIEAQVLSTHEERRLAAALPSMTSVPDESPQVRAMYEANPYPRWVIAQHPPAMTVASLIQTLRPEIGTSAVGKQPRILVAGCGTGQQPIHLALTHRDAHIDAFDLSRPSLGYAARMAESMGVHNVSFAWGDLMALEPAADGLRYDVVSCSGVLHHLRDPLAGWRRLLTRLAPHGVMKVGLYSTHARASIVAAQQVVKDLALPATDDGLRQARQTLLGLPASHPASSVRTYLDMYSLSGVRDLVMHVQERSYTVPEIADALHTLNLRFLGFQLPQIVQSQFRAEHPQPSAALDLQAWDAFEQRHPSTFRAMYQFWCCAC